MNRDTIRDELIRKGKTTGRTTVDKKTARREYVYEQLIIARRNLLDAVDHFAAKVEANHGRISRADSNQWRGLVAVCREIDQTMAILHPHVGPEVRAKALADDGRDLRIPKIVEPTVPDSLSDIAALFPELDWS